MKFRIRNLNKVQYLSIYILVLLTCFMPLYISNTNIYNLRFCIIIIPVLMFVLANIVRFKRKKDRLLGLLVGTYMIVFGIYNILYLKCYWAWIYNSLTFLMLWMFTGYDRAKLGNEEYIAHIIDVIIFIFTVSVAISIILNIIGIDAIYWDLGAFHIRGSYSGVFLDRRLTWVYLHKSAYGLLMGAVLALILKRESLSVESSFLYLDKKKRLLYRNLFIGFYFFAALIINSMVSLLSMAGVVFAFYIGKKKKNGKYFIKIVILFLLAIIVGAAGFYYLNQNRDIGSLGDRIYIWPMFGRFLKNYPNGMGLDFYTDRLWMSRGREAGRYINNVHNVFMNEMLHYSILVGALYSILILYIPLRGIKQKSNRLKKIILFVSLILPMIFDQAMNDLIFPFYMVLLYLCFYELPSPKEKEIM